MITPGGERKHRVELVNQEPHRFPTCPVIYSLCTTSESGARDFEIVNMFSSTEFQPCTLNIAKVRGENYPTLCLLRKLCNVIFDEKQSCSNLEVA